MNSFAVNNLATVFPLSAHDEQLAGDTLTTLTINFEWRRFIGQLLTSYLENVTDFGGSDEIDYLNQVRALVDDFYTASATGGTPMLETVRVHRSVDQSTSGGLVGTVFWSDPASDPYGFDPHGFYTAPPNHHLLTVPAGLGGIYLATANVIFGSQVNTGYDIRIEKNGALEFARQGARDVSQRHSCSGVIDLAAGDNVRLNFLTGNNALVLAFETFPALSLTRLADLP